MKTANEAEGGRTSNQDGVSDSPHLPDVPIQQVISRGAVVGDDCDWHIEGSEGLVNLRMGAGEIVSHLNLGGGSYAQHVGNKDNDCPGEPAEGEEVTDSEFRFLICGFGLFRRFVAHRHRLWSLKRDERRK